MSDKDSLDDGGKTAPAQELVSAVPFVSDPVSGPVIWPVTGPPPEKPGSDPAGLSPRETSNGSKHSECPVPGVRPAGSDPEQTGEVVTAVEARVAPERTDEDTILPAPESGPLNEPAANARRVEDFIVPAAEPNALALGDLQWFDIPHSGPLTVKVPPAAVEVLDFDAVTSAASPPESRPEKSALTLDAPLPVAAHDDGVSGAVDAALDNSAPQDFREPDPERAPLLVRLGIEPDADVAPNTAELLTSAEMPTIATVEQIPAPVVADNLEPAPAQAEVMAADMTVVTIVSGTTVSDSQIEPVAAPQPQPPSAPPVTEAPPASLSRWPRERSPVQARAPEPIHAFTQPPVHRALLQPNVEVPLTTRPEPFETKLPPPQPAPVAAPPRHWVRRAGMFAVRALAAYAALLICLVVLFRFVDPPGSALIALRWLSGTEIQRSWVPIETMSPQLVRAVIVSEDWSFCTHNGIDLEAIEQAIEKAGDGIPRGASTISMQVAKNVFLWPSKSYVRKAIEVPLTLLMEFIWPKRRILEVYLNVAEWGPGIFGAEAAAQHHFQKPASSLTAREAAQLAASLPNPFRRDAGDPGPQTARKAGIIQARMRIAGPVADCVLQYYGASTTKQRSN